MELSKILMIMVKIIFTIIILINIALLYWAYNMGAFKSTKKSAE